MSKHKNSATEFGAHDIAKYLVFTALGLFVAGAVLLPCDG